MAKTADKGRKEQPTRPYLNAAVTEADEKVIEWMKSHPKEVIKERTAFMEKLHKRRCLYGSKGGTLPVTLAPMFLKEESLDLIRRVSETLDRVVDKVIELYFKDEAVRSYYPYPDLPEEWVKVHPGYSKPTVLNRHDAIFDGKNLKFIEFNTDNPGGRGWTDTFEDLFREFPPYADLLKNYARHDGDRPMLRHLKDALLACWRDYGGKAKPRIALTSYKSFVPGSDDEIVRDYLVEHGLEAHCVDSRDFEYRGGKLYSGRVPFDLLNMTLRFLFFKRFPRENRDFLAAVRDRAVCQVNPWRAIIGSQKEVMSVMTNETFHHHFTKQEVKAIKEHVPWTRSMHETVTISPEGTDVSLKEYALKERERLVIKVTTGAGGQEVVVGKDTDKAEWAGTVDNTLGSPWYIIQDAVQIPEFEMPVLKGSKVVLEKKKLNVNPYVYNGRYAGCLARASESSVINVARQGGIVPVFAIKSGSPDRRKQAGKQAGATKTN